jgi:hypothetical protein
MTSHPNSSASKRRSIIQMGEPVVLVKFGVREEDFFQLSMPNKLECVFMFGVAGVLQGDSIFSRHERIRFEVLEGQRGFKGTRVISIALLVMIVELRDERFDPIDVPEEIQRRIRQNDTPLLPWRSRLLFPGVFPPQQTHFRNPDIHNSGMGLVGI